MSGGGGKEPSAGARGILGILGRRRVFRFWVFAEGPDLGPSAKMFLFFKKKILCRVPLAQHSAKTVFAECQAGTRQIFNFFLFFYPKFFVGPAYIVYNFMFKFGAFSSFFVIFG